ncbi:MAG: DUF3667 domain-containing protein [Chitinophagaceae bacterium]
MSHVPQRKEKDCLNCGAIVQGRYCHVCGQENVVPKETFWHMFTHFFYDITHFDSKFFESVKDLVFRPGFLSKEYMLGKRASYLHPVRMYVFTSAMFFLIFFSFFSPKESGISNNNIPVSAETRAAYIETLENRIKSDKKNAKLLSALAWAKDTSRPLTGKDILVREGNGLSVSFNETDYKSVEEYDSLQKALPAKQRDGWFKSRLIRKQTEINIKYRENPEEAAQKLIESILHRLPYMLFVSLPLFALILKLVYVRRKQFYFADHGVLTIHLYIFSFLLLLMVFLFNWLNEITGWSLFTFLNVLLFILLFFYLYKAMRNFYGQRRGKTFLKFLFVSFWSFIMMLLLFVLFMFFSAFTL